MTQFQLFNWHLEISSKCALKCPRCPRTENPNSFTPKQLGLDFIKKVFSPDFLKKEVLRITLSGGLGDAIYNSELIQIVEYLKSCNPQCQVVLVTNGSYKEKSWWKSLTDKMNEFDEIIFSIDGWDQESNSLYRINSDWSSIMVGISVAVESKVSVRWSTIVFKFNQKHLDKIRDLSQSLGVDSFHLVLSERFNSHYDSKELDPLEPDINFVSEIPKVQRFKENFSTHPGKRAAFKEFHTRFNAKYEENVKAAQAMFSESYIFPSCFVGHRGAYIDVEGRFFPCSWVSHPFDRKHSVEDPSRILLFKDSIAAKSIFFDLHQKDLSQILAEPTWQQLQRSWSEPSEAYIICERKCIAKNSSPEKLGTRPMRELNKS